MIDSVILDEQIIIKQRVRCGEMNSQFRKRLIRKIKNRSRARGHF